MAYCLTPVFIGEEDRHRHTSQSRKGVTVPPLQLCHMWCEFWSSSSRAHVASSAAVHPSPWIPQQGKGGDEQQHCSRAVLKEGLEPDPEPRANMQHSQRWGEGGEAMGLYHCTPSGSISAQRLKSKCSLNYSAQWELLGIFFRAHSLV